MLLDAIDSSLTKYFGVKPHADDDFSWLFPTHVFIDESVLELYCIAIISLTIRQG